MFVLFELCENSTITAIGGGFYNYNRGLAVACWTTDNYYPCSNLGISEGWLIFDFASLSLEVAWPI